MKPARTKDVYRLLDSLQHVYLEQITADVLLSENLARIWKNCTALSNLAQSLADPHGKTRMAQLCARVVGASAECKADLLRLMEMPGLSRREAMKYTNRATKRYSELKEAVKKMGAETGSYWGRSLHVLL